MKPSACIQAYGHTYTLTCLVLLSAYVRMCLCRHTHTHTCIYVPVQTHTYTHRCANANWVHTYMYTCIRRYLHARAHTAGIDKNRLRMCTYMYKKRIYARTNSYACTYTQTNTHHAYIQTPPPRFYRYKSWHWACRRPTIVA
jgi:hypothetical protein